MKELSVEEDSQISDAAVQSIVEEAVRRAAEKEKDGVARASPFLDELDRAAREAAKVLQGDRTAESRIRVILEFHRTK